MSEHNGVDELIILYLTYGGAYKEGLAKLDEIVNKMFFGVKVKKVIIDNSLRDSIVLEINESTYLINGDNSQLEFSGWDYGISFINEQFHPSKNTIIAFANDTFHERNYKDGQNFLDIFDSPLLKEKNVLESAIGYIDDFPKEVRIGDITYKSWIRSNIFFLPISVVNQMYPLTIEFPMDKVFSDDINKFWSESDFISEAWKAYISSWLFGIENYNFPEYRLHWLKAETLRKSNWAFFKKKALCILSEHYLSARLHRLTIPIIDTNLFEKKVDRHLSDYYK